MSGNTVLLAAVYAAGLAAWAAFFTLGASLLRDEWRGAPRGARSWAAAALLAAFAAGGLLSVSAGLRAGRHNEHSFAFLATRPFPEVDAGQLFQERDLSPRLLLSVYERVAGRSFPAVRAFQASLWGLCGLFAFLALRRGGLHWAAAAFGAGLLFFNRHAALLGHSLAPDGAALMLFLAGAYALARLDAEEAPRKRSAALLFFWAVNLLLSLAKNEFCVGQWPILAYVLWRGRKRSFHRPRAVALAAWLAFVLEWAHVIWLEQLIEGRRSFPGAWLSPPAVLKGAAGNLHYHLAQAGLAPEGGAAAAALALVLAGALALAVRKGGAPVRFWAACGLPWLGYFALIHVPQSLHPLSHSRHHAFVLVPAALLLGALAHAALRALPAAPGRALLGGLLVLYAGINASALEAASGELRTSDREWRFLQESRRAWPDGCAAVYPFHDHRRAVLEKYFPRPSPEPAPDACLLLYRSSRAQTFAFLDRPAAPAALPAGARPWRETAFQHRHYTDWHGPWVWEKMEALGPLPVLLGFYRVDAAAWRRLAAETPVEAPDGSLPHGPARWAENEPEAEWLRGDWSLETCYKRAPPGEALACYDRALERARSRPQDEDEAVLLASRAELLRGLGRVREAQADLAAGRRAAAEPGGGSVRAARSLDAVQRWLAAGPR